MRIEYQDDIDRYVLGRMTDDERLEFEEKLSKNDELKEQMEHTKAVRDVLERFEEVEILKRIEKMEEEDELEKPEYKPTGSGYEYTVKPDNRICASPRSSNRKFIYWISGIAAVFIMGIIIFNTLPSTSPGIGMESTSQPSYSSNRNGNVSFKGGRQMNIESLLTQGDYSKALAQIEKDEANVKTELMLIEREMSSRGEKPDSVKVQQKKNKLINLQYLKAQALIGLNRKEEAVILLEEIRHSDSKFMEQADSLYNILKK